MKRIGFFAILYIFVASVLASTAFAAYQQLTSQSSSDNFSTIKEQIQKTLADRIDQYTQLSQHLPSSLSDAEKQTFTLELSDAIDRMNARLSFLDTATSTNALTIVDSSESTTTAKEDSLLEMKVMLIESLDRVHFNKSSDSTHEKNVTSKSHASVRTDTGSSTSLISKILGLDSFKDISTIRDLIDMHVKKYISLFHKNSASSTPSIEGIVPTATTTESSATTTAENSNASSTVEGTTTISSGSSGGGSLIISVDATSTATTTTVVATSTASTTDQTDNASSTPDISTSTPQTSGDQSTTTPDQSASSTDATTTSQSQNIAVPPADPSPSNPVTSDEATSTQ
jgi:hypothetical protein